MCPECEMVEMRVDKVKEGKIYFVCRKCGLEKVIEEKELKTDE